jgi:endonuclease/exonuclease/phosphatase family metal-dependent hydrolase
VIKLKIATFNIWNSDVGMPLREKQIINEIKSVNSDLICLQEVRIEVYKNLVSELKEYDYNYFLEDKDHGLVIFSKYPILTKKQTTYGIIITLKYENNVYLITNVHLPSEKITPKEKAIVEIINEINNTETDYAFLVGDFNCSENSSVHNFIKGESTLLNSEAYPYWYDTAEVYSEITNTKLENTLDLRTNPRWKGKNVASTSGRLDRIYFRDSFPKPFPELKSFSLFGKDIDDKTGYCASDHYGIVAEIIVKK